MHSGFLVDTSTKSGQWRACGKSSLSLQLVNSPLDSCCNVLEWLLVPLRGGATFFAHAAIVSLRARAAQKHNGRVGLSRHIRRAVKERLVWSTRHFAASCSNSPDADKPDLCRRSFCSCSICSRAQHRNFSGAAISTKPAIQMGKNRWELNRPFAALCLNSKDADQAAVHCGSSNVRSRAKVCLIPLKASFYQIAVFPRTEGCLSHSSQS